MKFSSCFVTQKCLMTSRPQLEIDDDLMSVLEIGILSPFVWGGCPGPFRCGTRGDEMVGTSPASLAPGHRVSTIFPKYARH